MVVFESSPGLINRGFFCKTFCTFDIKKTDDQSFSFG